MSKQTKKLPRSNKPPIFTNISDSDNGEDTCNDDSDIDKSYDPANVTKNGNNESSDDNESIISTILNKKNSETQLLGTMRQTEAEIIHDIPDFNILSDINNEQIGYCTPLTSKSATMEFVTQKPSTSKSVSTPSAAVITPSYTGILIIAVLSYSVETIKNMTAQVLDSSIPKETLEFDVSDGCEILWPVENTEDMEKIEKLLVDIKIRKYQAIIFSRLAGSKINDSVRRIMQRMFLDTFIKDYSYVGFKGKNKFQGLNCCRLLFDSIRINKKFEMTSDEEISTSVSKWMSQVVAIILLINMVTIIYTGLCCNIADHCGRNVSE
eukprot:XP_016659930.1 PREDICTED: uncharacterized protein LOC107883769 [Acyrthosiphon pisum]